MSDRTGMAMGRVRPVIYFESSSGYVILAPQEVGHDLRLARRVHQEKYRDWEWKEAGSFSEVTELQKRLQKQELDEAIKRRDISMAAYDAAKSKTAAQLRQRMTSADCTPFERDWILAWLQLAPEKRAKYEQRFLEHQHYLWALENSESKQVIDHMPAQPGEFWRTDAQQKT